MRRNSRLSFFERLSATNVFIALNVIFFFVVYLIYTIQGDTFFTGAFSYLSITPSLFLKGYIWTALTSVFLHVEFFHLFVNMFSLFFLGSFVERIIGRKRFVWFYLVAGIVGGLFFVAFAYIGQYIPRGESLFGSMMTPAVGASGAIFGLLGILAVLFPRKKVYLMVGPIIVIIAQVIVTPFLPDTFAAVVNSIASVIIILMIFAVFSWNSAFRKLAVPLELSLWVAPIVAIVPLVVISIFVELPIGNTAHFGGLIAGLIFGYYLRRKYSKKVKMLNQVIR